MQEVMTDQQKSITFTYSVRWNQVSYLPRARPLGTSADPPSLRSSLPLESDGTCT